MTTKCRDQNDISSKKVLINKLHKNCREADLTLSNVGPQVRIDPILTSPNMMVGHYEGAKP